MHWPHKSPGPRPACLPLRKEAKQKGRKHLVLVTKATGYCIPPKAAKGPVVANQAVVLRYRSSLMRPSFPSLCFISLKWPSGGITIRIGLIAWPSHTSACSIERYRKNHIIYQCQGKTTTVSAGQGLCQCLMVRGCISLLGSVTSSLQGFFLFFTPRKQDIQLLFAVKTFFTMRTSAVVVSALTAIAKAILLSRELSFLRLVMRRTFPFPLMPPLASVRKRFARYTAARGTEGQMEARKRR